ncbi:MAG: DNA-binding protein [Deltaproteobacteria bacterium]|nr:DNA-binding protein [Deltaproteobacteria bacterium]
MKNLGRFTSIIGILALVLAATAAWAQPGMGPGGGQGRGMGAGNSYNRMYDPKTVATVSGEVESLSQSTSGRRMAYGVHLTLKTEKETIPVHLGPSWYLEKQGITFAPKDKVEVTGSRIMYQGQPAIIAQEVKKGGQVLKLRDAAGVPAWAGQRRQ